MRIYFIRHADPYYPDDSLTPAGHREAQALAGCLGELGLDEIYSSPRGRARLTAAYTAERLGLPVQIEPWTAELDGLQVEEYQEALWDIPGEALRAPHLLENLTGWQRIPPLDHPRLAEHVQNIRVHSDEFLARQGFTRDGPVYRFSQPNRKRIALFAHLGFGLTWLAHLLEIPLPLMWAGFYLQPSSVTTILFEERPAVRPAGQPTGGPLGLAVPRLLSMGDTSHLGMAGLKPTNRGLVSNSD